MFCLLTWDAKIPYYTLTMDLALKLYLQTDHLAKGEVRFNLTKLFQSWTCASLSYTVCWLCESFPYVWPRIPKWIFKIPRAPTLSSTIWPLPFVHCVCPAWLLSSFSPLIGLHTMKSVLQLSEKACCAVSEKCRSPRCVHNFAFSSIQALWQTANCLVSMCQATWFSALFDCTGPFLNVASVLYGLTVLVRIAMAVSLKF